MNHRRADQSIATIPSELDEGAKRVSLKGSNWLDYGNRLFPDKLEPIELLPKMDSLEAISYEDSKNRTLDVTAERRTSEAN